MPAKKDIGPCDLSGGDDFWLEITVSTAPKAQAAIAAALRATPAGKPIIQVGLIPASEEGSSEIVVAVDHKAIGLLPSHGGRFDDLAEALSAHDFSGACGALVIENSGLYGLRLNLDRAHATAPPTGQDASL